MKFTTDTTNLKSIPADKFDVVAMINSRMVYKSFAVLAYLLQRADDKGFYTCSLKDFRIDFKCDTTKQEVFRLFDELVYRELATYEIVGKTLNVQLTK